MKTATRIIIPSIIILLFALSCAEDSMPSDNNGQAIVFATFAETDDQLEEAFVLAESIRTFAGKYKDAPIWIYVHENFMREGHIHVNDIKLDRAKTLDVKIHYSTSPRKALKFYYAGKVFGAAKCEQDAREKAAVLVWMDHDTVILKEPGEFALPANRSFGYRPVMHKLIASAYSEPPDSLWSRIYEILDVDMERIFPMSTFTDHITIRPYFNAGIIVVCPEKSLMKNWSESFVKLYSDSVIYKLCMEEKLNRIFLHQAALAGAVMNTIDRDEMVELSDNVNYPLFFKAMFGSEKEYDDLTNVVSLRYDTYFRNPDSNWADKLKGPSDRVSWLKERLGK